MDQQSRLQELTKRALAGDQQALREAGEMILGGGVRADEPRQSRIEYCKDPNFPQFRFEWHPHNGKVYLIELPGVWAEGHFVEVASSKPLQAAVVAEHAEHHARFLGFVQTWLRGYKKAKADLRG